LGPKKKKKKKKSLMEDKRNSEMQRPMLIEIPKGTSHR